MLFGPAAEVGDAQVAVVIVDGAGEVTEELMDPVLAIPKFRLPARSKNG